MAEISISEQPRIALIGTGALGSAFAERLASARVPHVLLIDPDRMREHNLPISPFLARAWRKEEAKTPSCHGVRGTAAHARPSDMQKPFKAELLTALAQSEGLPWRAMPVEIADTGWQSLLACDLLCCATDSALSRAETAFAARMLGKPMIEAGVQSNGEPRCRVAWFPAAPEAACYLCNLREDRRAQILAYAGSASLGCAPLEDAPPMTGTPEATAEAADGMLRLLLGFVSREGPPADSRAWRLTRSSHSAWIRECISLPRSGSCPWHSGLRGELTPLPWNLPIQQSVGDAVLQLAWPACTRARCRLCGTATEPFRRVAFVRRSMPCPGCGCRGCMQPVESVDSIKGNDPLRACSPRQLGQPQSHLYALRRVMNFTATGMDSSQETVEEVRA